MSKSHELSNFIWTIADLNQDEEKILRLLREVTT